MQQCVYDPDRERYHGVRTVSPTCQFKTGNEKKKNEKETIPSILET